MNKGSREDPVHEAYAFVCLDCGHGWEEEFEISHPQDTYGLHHAVYYSHGHRVPSPLCHGRSPAFRAAPLPRRAAGQRPADLRGHT